jgi:hypothetical protein
MTLYIASISSGHPTKKKSEDILVIYRAITFTAFRPVLDLAEARSCRLC